MAFFKLRKHLNKNLLAFLRCQTLKKFINFLRVEYGRKLARTHLHSFPYILTIDITNICNLKCPFCPTGMRRSGRKKGFMELSLFKAIIDQLKHYVYIANLFNWGESLLHPDIFKMIKYADENNIFTAVSSNFNIPFDEPIAVNLVKSGLKYLYLSVDGASQETYSKYRVGGDFGKVINNLKTLLKAKAQLESYYPIIEWRFLVFKHNEAEIPLARKMAKDLGIDRISFEGGVTENLADRKGQDKDDWLPEEDGYKRTHQSEESKCDWLWRNLTINWDGSISACCWSFDEADDFGILQNNFHLKWNNDKFLAARSLFSLNKYEKQGILCDNCIKVRKRFNLKMGYLK